MSDFVLVPREPTPEMCTAGASEQIKLVGYSGVPTAVYLAMLAAAPAPMSGGDADDGLAVIYRDGVSDEPLDIIRANECEAPGGPKPIAQSIGGTIAGYDARTIEACADLVRRLTGPDNVAAHLRLNEIARAIRALPVTALSDREEIRKVLEEQAAFLNQLSGTLLAWAKESREHGWSTHQVAANIERAEACRTRSVELRAALATPSVSSVEKEDSRP